MKIFSANQISGIDSLSRSPEVLEIEAPVIVIVEAKKADCGKPKPSKLLMGLR